jgi:hypothetical protein
LKLLALLLSVFAIPLDRDIKPILKFNFSHDRAVMNFGYHLVVPVGALEWRSITNVVQGFLVGGMECVEQGMLLFACRTDDGHGLRFPFLWLRGFLMPNSLIHLSRVVRLIVREYAVLRLCQSHNSKVLSMVFFLLSSRGLNFIAHENYSFWI